jgi:transcription antitermination factor NusG
MRYALTEKRNGIKNRQLVPAIHNLIFVRTTSERIKSLKQGVDFLQYLTRPKNGKNVPVTVPDREMQQFITVTEKSNEELIYLNPEEIDLKKGTRVRVHGGAFDGTTGMFIKIRGKRNKRVVIELEGLTAVALAEIKPDLLEILP